LTAESILKRAYADKKKQPQHQDKEIPSIYKGARCKVCLIKENDQLPPVLINNANKVYELVKDELATADRETLLSIMLDTSLHLIGIETVAIGSINACGSKVSEIFKSAILSNASCIILCHNHPSGSLEPSVEDIAFTKNIIKCGILLNIKVHDHLIISNRGFWSMSEQGLIRV
jgi:DNA repair protein RadC